MEKQEKMIDMQTLADYSKFINIKEICLLSGVNYNTIKNKVRLRKQGHRIKLNKKQSILLREGFKKLGIIEPNLKPIKN